MAFTVIKLIKKAFQLGGIVDAGINPTVDEINDALNTYNQMKKAMFGDMIGQKLVSKPMPADTTAFPGRNYQFPGNTSLTLILPLAPKAGARVGVTDSTNRMATNNLVVLGNGYKIEGVYGAQNLHKDGDNRIWWFNDETGDWVLEQDSLLNDVFEFSSVLEEAFIARLAIRLATEYGPQVPQGLQALADQGGYAINERYGRRGRNAMNPPTGLMTPNNAQRQPVI